MLFREAAVFVRYAFLLRDLNAENVFISVLQDIMNLLELKEMVAGGESEQVEFKRSTGQRSEAIKTVCAMLNGEGGYVLFGITDSGEIAGQQVSNRTMDELSNELQRIEPLYPPLALREAIANALCHRDYTIPGGAVSVAMYDNHLEVTNPGALHFGITPEKLQ